LPWSKVCVPCARSVSPRELPDTARPPDCPSQPPRGAVPSFLRQHARGARSMRASVLANPRDARRSQECGSSAALPPWRLPRARMPPYGEALRAAWLSSGQRLHDAPQDDVPRRASALRRALIIFLHAMRRGVDSARPRGLYRRFTVRGSPRRYCAPAKFLTDTRFIRGPGVRFRSEARNFGGSPGLGRAGPPGPGCLTSESEERETWTAESLRAVCLRGATQTKRRPDETSAVHVSGQHPLFVRAIARMTTVGPRQT
jgi:hypothetical protein